MSKEVREVVS